jgi:long-chain acyl-CoA synthetase
MFVWIRFLTHVFSPSWQIMQHACMAVGITIATAYDTLGESGLTHSFNEPECVGVFTNAELLPTVLRVLPSTPTIKLVIYDGTPTADLLNKLKTATPHREVKVLSQDELRELGKGKPEHEDRRPKAEDTACIIYTSGTTGPPKGVVLSQANLIATIGAIQSLMGHIFAPEHDTFLAFLPLAHILEYVVELAFGYIGLQIGYGRIRTLTDASVRNCQGDLKEFRPTLMIGVPQIWETIRKGIMNNVNKAGAIKKSVFKGGMAIKKAGVPVLSGLVDNIVLAQVKAQTGGRLRYVLNGGAALSVETQEFLGTALVTVLQGMYFLAWRNIAHIDPQVTV